MPAEAATADGPAWTHEIYDLLRKKGVTQFAYVPDAGHKAIINLSLADPDVHSIPLTTEEEGVGIMVGAHLGGEKAVLCMQSSGAGNCINFLSFVKNGPFPMLMLLSMRGEFGEGNPWQMPMGQATQPVLEAMGVICLRAEHADEVLDVVNAAADMVWKSGQAVAVLLTQRLIGAKAF